MILPEAERPDCHQLSITVTSYNGMTVNHATISSELNAVQLLNNQQIDIIFIYTVNI